MKLLRFLKSGSKGALIDGAAALTRLLRLEPRGMREWSAKGALIDRIG
jgi:hypothetical protein